MKPLEVKYINKRNNLLSVGMKLLINNVDTCSLSNVADYPNIINYELAKFVSIMHNPIKQKNENTFTFNDISEEDFKQARTVNENTLTLSNIDEQDFQQVESEESLSQYSDN